MELKKLLKHAMTLTELIITGAIQIANQFQMDGLVRMEEEHAMKFAEMDWM